MNSAIHIENLKVELDGHRILTDVNLDIYAGDFVFLLGANGSGKSTLVKAILGLIPTTVGHIQIFGQSNSQLQTAKHFGYVPQFAAIDREFPISVNEMIDLECTRAGHCRHGTGQHLSYFDSASLLKKRLSDLSGGELQKVLIARALVTDPEVIILDEPTNNLDQSSQQVLFEILRKLNREEHKTIIVVTHDHQIIDQEHDKVWLVSEGSIKQLTESDQTEYLHHHAH